MKVKKYILNILFLLVLMLGTLYFLLKDQEISDITRYIQEAKKSYLIIGAILVVIYIALESVIIYYLLRKLSTKMNFLSCLKYSFIGFFVSAITPSATGGQPAQLYYMAGDGLSTAISTLVLMVVTITYKFALLFLGVLMFFIDYNFVIEHVSSIWIILAFSVTINIVIVAFLMFIIFNHKFTKRFIGKCIIFLNKKKIIKNHKKLLRRVLAAISKYEDGAVYLKSNFGVFIKVFAVTVVQRVALFAVTYFVYRAFGLSGYGIVEIVILQLIISLAVDNIPLPGGMGANEGVFLVFFTKIFTPAFITAGLLLSRFLSYYLIIILGGIVLAYAQITRSSKIKSRCM